MEDERLARFLGDVHHHRGEFLGEDARRSSRLASAMRSRWVASAWSAKYCAERLLLVRGGGRRRQVGGLAGLRLQDGDDFWGEVAVVVGAGHGEDFEAGGDEAVAVAEVELDGHEWRFGGVDWLGERDGDVGGAVVRRIGRPAVFVAGVEDAFGAVVG